MADEYYNNKIVTTDGDVLMDLTQDTATPETVLEGETFHLRSGAPATGTYRPSDEIEARLEATVGHSSKNLLKITADSQTIKGVTFTVDKTAGTITVNGQVSSSATMAQLDIVSRRDVDSSLNGLILTEPASKTIPNYGFRTAIAYYNSSGTYISEQVINSGNPNPVVVSVPSNAYTYKVYVRATTSAGTLNNLVIKPMFREASISDDTFEPYQEPTDSLIETKARAYLTSTVGHSSKNLLKLETSTKTSAGITYTVNEKDGTVTATGTVTTGQNSYYNIAMDLPEGNYYFYGCPTGGSNSKYDVFPWDNMTTARPKQWDGTTEAVSDYDMTPKQFKVIAGHSLRLSIRIRSEQTVNNLVFKPMVWDGSISDDTFEPYVTPTDEAKIDKPVELVSTATNTFIYPSVSDLKSKYSMLLVTFADSSRSNFASVWIPTNAIKNNINEQSNYNYASTGFMIRSAPVSIWDDGVHISSAESDETIISIQAFPK